MVPSQEPAVRTIHYPPSNHPAGSKVAPPHKMDRKRMKNARAVHPPPGRFASLPLLALLFAALLAAHIRALTRYPSRVVGYEGEQQAAEYVHGQFQEIFGSVEEQPFQVTVPKDDDNSQLRLPTGETFRLRGLWPNAVRTSQLPKEGL